MTRPLVPVSVKHVRLASASASRRTSSRWATTMPGVRCVHCDADKAKPMNDQGSAFLDASYLAHQQKIPTRAWCRRGRGPMLVRRAASGALERAYAAVVKLACAAVTRARFLAPHRRANGPGTAASGAVRQRRMTRRQAYRGVPATSIAATRTKFSVAAPADAARTRLACCRTACIPRFPEGEPPNVHCR